MNHESAWYTFQEEIATYFRSLGTYAETNKTVQGVRTKHDIDIYIKTKFLNVDLVWIVEAKKWQSKVPKEKVLALRSIVDDIGADKGLIISEVGFQKGAYEAARDTNILLYTIDEFKKETQHLVQTEILKMYSDRARLLDIRYWSHSKQIRNDYNLRPDMFDLKFDFSGTELLFLIFKAIYQGIQSHYPIELIVYSKRKIGRDRAENFDELINWLNLNLNMLDRILLKAEYAMLKNDDFHPDTEDNKFIDFYGVPPFISTSELMAEPELAFKEFHRVNKDYKK